MCEHGSIKNLKSASCDTSESLRGSVSGYGHSEIVKPSCSPSRCSRQYIFANLAEVDKTSCSPSICSRQYILANLAEDLRYKPPPSDHPAVEKLFKSMDIRNEGKITSQELQTAFEMFQGRRFSDATCKFVVRLFDLDRNGGLDIKEFEAVYYHMKQWINAFKSNDTDQSGTLTASELDCTLKQLDIHFSPEFIHFLVTKNNPKLKKMSLDQYIITCIQIQKFTDEYKKKDINGTGQVGLTYEDFLELIMKCT